MKRLCALVALFSCCATAKTAPWPTYHGGTDLDGASPVSLPDQPSLLWRYNAGSPVDHTPVSDGERIFFATRAGRIVALDLFGHEAWSRAFSSTNDAGQAATERYDAPLAVAGGTVLAGSRKGLLHALDATSGAERWNYATGGTIMGTPNFADVKRAVVIDESDGVLHCVDLRSGKPLWKTEGVERCDCPPSVGNGRIVFGACDTSLHFYSAIDGRHLADVALEDDAQMAGGAAIEGDRAYVGTREGALVCVDAVSTNVVWSFAEASKQAFSTPALSGDCAIFSSDDGFVYAVRKDDGRLVWKYGTGGLPTSAVVAGERVAVSVDGDVRLLDVKDGRKLWSATTGDTATSPALAGGMLVAGADDGTVSAWGAK